MQDTCVKFHGPSGVVAKIYILRQSDPTGVRLSDHSQTARFDPLEVGLNVGCNNLTHG
jgi:hypothetical protein